MDESVLDVSDAEDAARIQRVARGDLEAFRALFARYYPRVYAFVRRRLRDPGQTEDIVAEVFFELWRSAGRYRGQARPSTFLCGIAHFKCLSAIRAERRHKRANVTSIDTGALVRVPDPSNAAAELESRDEVRHVRRALDQLPEGHRKVVELAFVDGLAYAEIADRLGVAEGTVKTRVARARAQLRRVLSRPRSLEDS
ncbi:MAG TPA: RNA polymerase sigma factor [Myxococcota bacterium]|nr:RNA polymerase sigma factor [Myxococcota bacterium]